MDDNNVSPNSSVSSESSESSVSTEEERLRRLFDACDNDEDGFLDKDDFITMCERLNMADSANKIIEQLGLKDEQRISFDEFLSFKQKFIQNSDYPLCQTCLTSSYYMDLSVSSMTNQLPQCDISFAPNNVSSWLTISSDNSLGAVSGKPESADYDSGARDLSPEPRNIDCHFVGPSGDGEGLDDGYTSLQKNAKMQMSTCLHGGLEDLTKQLFHLSTDRDVLERRLQKTQEDYHEKIEQTTARYEERITELHSVIAELQKKLLRQNSNIIREEDEAEESVKSASDSVSFGADGERSPTASIDELCDGNCPPSCTAKYCDDPNCNIYENLVNNLEKLHKSPSCTDMPQTPSWKSPGLSNQEEISRLHCLIETIQQDRDKLASKVRELEEKCKNSGVQSPTTRSPESFVPVSCSSKIAELKQLKSPVTSCSSLLAKDRFNRQKASFSHLTDKLAVSLDSCESLDDLAELVQQLADEVAYHQVHELNLAINQLQCSIDNLKSQNRVIALTLEESRAQSERLSVLLGRYESNNTALQMSVSYSDQSIEVYEVLCTYLEAEQGLLLANCRAAGLGSRTAESVGRGNHEEVKVVLQQAQTGYNAAETLARHVIHNLDTRLVAQSLQPWHDHSLSSSTGSSSETDRNEKQQLRDILTQLKQDRSAVKSTVLALESIHMERLTVPETDTGDSNLNDLEQAVLLQEMMNVKEEKAELKAQNYLLDKEKRALELQLAGKESKEKAYVVQIDQLKSELDDCMEYGRDEPVFQGMIQDVPESLKRERKLKQRVQELVGTMEKLSRNSECRHQQSADFISDLKHANSALITAFEKAKKKYQSKITKLESHLENMTETSQNQMAQLQLRISQLETDSQRNRYPNETSL